MAVEYCFLRPLTVFVVVDSENFHITFCFVIYNVPHKRELVKLLG